MLVVTSLDYGGADAQVVDLARRFTSRGVEAYVVSLLEPRAFTAELDRSAVTWRSLGMRPGIPDPRGAIRFIRFLRAVRPDIVHGHMFHANVLTRATARLGRVPGVVSTIHSIREGGRSRELVYRLTDRLADVTTAVSEAAGEYYESVGAVRSERLRVLPNGIDLARFQPDPAVRERVRAEFGVAERFTWLAAGRLDPAKDYATMLHAMRFVVTPGSPHRPVLLLAGRGPVERELRALVATLDIGDSVRFLGLRQDVPDLLRAADGYVLTSSFEGLPMVLLEAAASSLPIVATDVGGNRELVLDEGSGLLVPPADPPAVARAMLAVMEQGPLDRERMGKEGREHVAAHFGMESVADRWLSLYNDVLAGG